MLEGMHVQMAGEISDLMEREGVTQDRLAELANISRSKLNKALNHPEADINVATLVKIANALSCEIRLVPKKK